MIAFETPIERMECVAGHWRVHFGGPSRGT